MSSQIGCGWLYLGVAQVSTDHLAMFDERGGVLGYTPPSMTVLTISMDILMEIYIISISILPGMIVSTF